MNKARKGKKRNKKGAISIVLSLIMLSLILAAGLSSAAWVASGFNLSRTFAISAPAYYAAESGIEKTLYRIVADCDSCPKERPAADSSAPRFSENFTSTNYNVWVMSTAPFKAKSIGESGGDKMRRSIEINWEKSW